MSNTESPQFIANEKKSQCSESNFVREIFRARAKFSWYRYMISGMRAHAKFHTCCRYGEETSGPKYRGFSSSFIFRKNKVVPNFSLASGSRENFHVASPVSNLTEIGLEIPRKGWVNFRHLVVFLARRVKNHTSDKNQAVWKEQQRRAAAILPGRENAIWIAFVTNVVSSNRTCLWDCKSC